VVACVDGQPVSGGRVDLDPGVEFAGLFGGVTLPEFRRRGLYKATVARCGARAGARVPLALRRRAADGAGLILERLRLRQAHDDHTVRHSCCCSSLSFSQRGSILLHVLVRLDIEVLPQTGQRPAQSSRQRI
jgi:hypothetical protein